MVIANLKSMVDQAVTANVAVQETLQVKQEVIDKVGEAQVLVDNLNQSVVTKKQEISDLTEVKKQEILDEGEVQSEFVRDVGEEVIQEFDEHALHRVNQYDSNHVTKLDAYNENDSIKMTQYNENHVERLENINYAYADRIVEMIKTRNFMGILDEYVPKTRTHMITFLDTTDANYIYYANGTLLAENVDYTVYDSTTIELTVKANPYDVIIQVNTEVLRDMLTAEGVLFANMLGQPNGVASLDANGLVPTEQLPSYVDDVLEVETYADLPVEGETGKIYVVVADETSNGDTSSYRWTGTIYAMVSNTLNAADVKALYEANPNTNEYSDAEKAKLADIEDGATADQTAEEILALLKTVDGSGSELDADLLDGQEGAYYLDASNINAGTINNDRLPDTITSDITGNAATATKLQTARTIALTGDVSGSVNFDGSADIDITTIVADGSHNHIIDNVEGLQDALSDLQENIDIITSIEEW